MTHQIDFLVLAIQMDGATPSLLKECQVFDLSNGKIHIISRKALFQKIQAGIHFKTLRRSTCKKRLLTATIALTEDGFLTTKAGEKYGDSFDPLPTIDPSIK